MNRRRKAAGIHRIIMAIVAIGIAAASVAVASIAAPSPAAAAPELVAFPGAEGFGAGATGGRGGRVDVVTTLEPFGPGSLGEALAPKDCAPRTIVFRVSGVIKVPGKHDLELLCGNVTIAGQTAPGAGITVNGRVDGFGADPGGNIIMRHLRLRPPPLSNEEGGVGNLGKRYDALQLGNNPNVILDHLTLSWGSDETLDMHEGSNDSTVQWTTIEQSSPTGQPEGPHNDGMIAGPDSPRVSVHHTLFAHHEARCPALAAGPIELINNVMYDCKDAFVHHNDASGEFHVVGNTFVKGPSHKNFTPIFLDDEDPGGSTYWFSQNQFKAPGVYEGVADDISDTPLAEAAFEGAKADQILKTPTDFAQGTKSYQPVSTQPPAEAYEAVLKQAGAFPRDAVSTETINDVRNGTGDWTPNPPADLIAGLSPGTAPADGDNDGIADEWEATHGLDPKDGKDHAKKMPTGYTAIETYVNELSDKLVGATPPAGEVSAPGSQAGATQSAQQSSGAAPANGTPATQTAVAAVEMVSSSTNGVTYAALVLSGVAVVLAACTLVVVLRRGRPQG